MAVSDPRPRVFELLKRFGWNVTSFQVLEPEFQYWFAGDEACVAYVDTGSAWVAAGAPIAPEADLARVAEAFVAAARANRRRALFFATEERFQSVTDLDSLLIGEQPIYDPRQWADNVRRTPSLREQLRRARAKGVEVSRATPGELEDERSPLRGEIEALIARWIGMKPMPPMGFLVHVHPFLFAEHRRLFVARRAGTLVGFVGVIPVYQRNGWFIEDLIRAPDAPNGTVEVLVDAAMRSASREGSEYVTLGLAPLAGAVENWLHAASRYGAAFYDFAGLRTFKSKFRPRDWAPVYLSYPPDGSSYRAIYDSLVAFARGGLLRFGFETLLRGPDIVIRALTWLLVPWTLALWSVDPEDWFPARWVQLGWVGFDAVLFALLLAQGLRWRDWLARVLVGLTALDTLITLSEVCWFDVPRLRGPAELVVLTMAVVAPALACTVLSSAQRRVARIMRPTERRVLF